MGNEAKKTGPKITYGYTSKGAYYDQVVSRIQQDDQRMHRDKPYSSNKTIIVLDTGNALIPGRCYDHHQLSQEDKVRFPSATSMVFEYAKEIYEANKDAVEAGREIQLVCHDGKYPDNDAILSVVLAKYALTHHGEMPVGAEEIVRQANMSDTYTFSPEFNFGSLLNIVSSEDYVKAVKEEARLKERGRGRLRPDDAQYIDEWKKDSIDTAVQFTEAILAEYQKQYESEQDPEKRKALTLDSVLNAMMDKNSEYKKKEFKNWKYFHECQSEYNKNTCESIAKFNDMVARAVTGNEYTNNTIAQRDALVKQGMITGREMSYQLFDVNLCKRQVTKEEQEHDLESGFEERNVFVYTGSAPFDSIMALQALQNFDVTVVPKYDLQKGTVTMRISSQLSDLDMGHLGRLFETLMFQESLDKTKSNLSPREFEARKEEFIRRLTPLKEEEKGKHFTGFKSICGNDPTFFGYTVPITSKLASFGFIQETMEQYFADPQKIDQDIFEEIVGQELLDEVKKQKRPKVQEQEQQSDRPKKKTIIMTTNQGSKTITRPTKEVKKVEETSLEEIAEEIVDANLDENDVDNILSEVQTELEETTISQDDEDVLE